MLRYKYTRSAMKVGLEIERDIGVNPYKFGLYGTTDTHTALPTTREDNYFGKYQHTEPSANRHNVEVIPADDPALRILTAQESASGLTAVNAPDGTAPRFLVRALRDSDGANLDRFQIIKGWIDDSGATHERVFDIAVSGDREIGEDDRARASVGSTSTLKTRLSPIRLVRRHWRATGKTLNSTRRTTRFTMCA